MKNKKFSSIESIINIAKKGGMYILVDDENRENEGDLVFCSTDVNAKKINFMAKYVRGLICLTLDSAQAKKLGLSYMWLIRSVHTKDVRLLMPITRYPLPKLGFQQPQIKLLCLPSQ